MLGALIFLGIAVSSLIYTAILDRSTQASRAAEEIRRLSYDLAYRDVYYMEEEDDDPDPELTQDMLKMLKTLYI